MIWIVFGVWQKCDLEFLFRVCWSGVWFLTHHLRVFRIACVALDIVWRLVRRKKLLCHDIGLSKLRNSASPGEFLLFHHQVMLLTHRSPLSSRCYSNHGTFQSVFLGCIVRNRGRLVTTQSPWWSYKHWRMNEHGTCKERLWGGSGFERIISYSHSQYLCYEVKQAWI